MSPGQRRVIDDRVEQSHACNVSQCPPGNGLKEQWMFPEYLLI